MKRSIAIKNFLKSRGFKEIDPWSKYEHEKGLVVKIIDDSWRLYNAAKNAHSNGSLNDLSGLIKVISDELKS